MQQKYHNERFMSCKFTDSSFNELNNTNNPLQMINNCMDMSIMTEKYSPNANSRIDISNSDDADLYKEYFAN